MLLALVNGARNEEERQPCAKIQMSSLVVPLGSPVTATCIIREDCPLAIGQAVHVDWLLDDRSLPSSPGANESSRVSRVVIPSFNHTRAFLTCCVRGPPSQVVGGVEIRAGYPPEAPKNLSCQTNLTTPNTLTCSWNPGQQETHLLTKYTLYTEIWDSNENYTYELPPGVHQYVIPRSGFVLFSDMTIYVRAANELGEATSASLILEPVSTAKFDPPVILEIYNVPKKFGCLKLRWSLSPDQFWMYSYRLNMEVRLKTAESSLWNEERRQVSRIRVTKPVDLCRLLHGTRYVVQIRIRYKQSPWSEWSSSLSEVTSESAPTGRLESWMKVSGDHRQEKLNINLFWKPSKQFRANSQNVSYTVSVQKLPGERGKVCSTTENYCTFQISRKIRRVYLSAVNAAGRSPPYEARIYPPKAVSAISDTLVVPQDDRSLLIQWKSPVTLDLTGFIVEWRPLLTPDLSLSRFEITDRNQTSLLLRGSFEPDKPYGISVYPRFKDGIGRPQTVNAYSRQQAPETGPKLSIENMWQTQIELIWDEIPLQVRNGIIKEYKVFYWNEKGIINVVTTPPNERRVILTDLAPLSRYEAFIMVSTFGGSRNGTAIKFETEDLDYLMMTALPSCAGLVLIVIMVIACYYSHNRLKGHFWPAVPDPANSSIKRWTSESTQDSYLSFDSEEPNPVYLSHLSFLEIPTKISKEDHDDPWLNSSEDTSDLGESICGSPFIPGYSGSNSDSVTYATVIFSGPSSSSPPPQGPPVYLRSESTQPLLESEESFVPKCYQNMGSDWKPAEQCFFGPDHEGVTKEGKDLHTLLDDFPFLRALAMNDDHTD